MKKGDVNVSYNISEKLNDMFKVVATAKRERMTDLIQEWIRDYVVKHKAETNEIIEKWNTEARDK